LEDAGCCAPALSGLVDRTSPFCGLTLRSPLGSGQEMHWLAGMESICSCVGALPSVESSIELSLDSELLDSESSDPDPEPVPDPLSPSELESEDDAESELAELGAEAEEPEPDPDPDPEALPELDCCAADCWATASHALPWQYVIVQAPLGPLGHIRYPVQSVGHPGGGSGCEPLDE
jgi:hypothetical protein